MRNRSYLDLMMGTRASGLMSWWGSSCSPSMIRELWVVRRLTRGHRAEGGIDQKEKMRLVGYGSG